MKRGVISAVVPVWALLLLLLYFSFQATHPGEAANTIASTSDTAYVDWRNAGFEDGTTDHPWNTVSEGVAAVSTGGSVLIAAGTYTETLTIARSLALAGGYAPYDAPEPWSRDIAGNRTIIDGGGAGPVITLNCTCTSTIGGLTITGGSAPQGGGLYIQGAAVDLNQAQVSGNQATSAAAAGQGGGIYLVSASLSISATHVLSNTASQAGGGLYVRRGWTQILDSEFTGNNATNLAGDGEGGGVFAEGSALALLHSRVLTNTANYGGGIGTRDTQLLMDGNLIRNNCVDNYGGGIWATVSSGALRGNTIRDNCALLIGGAAAGDKAFTVTNNLIENNVGGGLLLQAGSVANNTVRRNLPNAYEEHGQGLLLSAPASPSFITVTNNIIVGNVYGIWASGSGLTINLVNNDVWDNSREDYLGLSPGLSDITADPLFVSSGPFAYRLLTGSPCIDTGTDGGAPVVDIEGQPRPQDGNEDGLTATDIGAYEYPAPTPSSGHWKMWLPLIQHRPLYAPESLPIATPAPTAPPPVPATHTPTTTSARRQP